MNRRDWTTPGLLAAMTAGHLAMSGLVLSDRSTEDVALFLGVFGLTAAAWAVAAVRAAKRPPSLRLVLVGALLLRAAALPAGYDFAAGGFNRLLLYDDDLWRYLWEGHAWSAAVDPLKTPPDTLEEYELELDDPALHGRLFDDPAWGDVWDHIGYRQFASPYGWTAHAAFVLADRVAPANVWFWKLLLVAFDLGVIALLLRIGRDHLSLGMTAAAIYAWCPTPVKEIAGSGHLDAILVFFLLLSLLGLLEARSGLGGAAAALAGLVKPTGWVLAPLLLKRHGWLALAPTLAAAALLLWHPPEGMKAYAAHWVFNPLLARFLPEIRWLELAFPLAATAAVALYFFLRDDGTPQAAVDYVLWTLGAFLLTTPMVAPWYFCWLLPFATLRRQVFWLALSVTVFLSYTHYAGAGNSWWVFAAQLGIPLAVWAIRNRSAA